MERWSGGGQGQRDEITRERDEQQKSGGSSMHDAWRNQTYVVRQE
jgi:hypothetical protein